MLVLDTDHFSELERGNAAGARLRTRLRAAATDAALTVVTIEEGTRGWLAQINRQRDVHQQIPFYDRLRRHVELVAIWTVLPWDVEAADLFLRFRREGVRIGTMDLKIACIARAHDATLLTRNAADFSQVPGLRVENWLD